MICIDLGANLGKHTRRMASSARQVIAFEPDPTAFSALRSNVADLENVRLENLAVGTSDERVLLYRHPRFESDPAAYSQSSTVVSDKCNVTAEGAVEVKQIDFLRYLEELGEDIGVLKIDIEGAEVDLLDERLGSLQAYQDFRFLLDQLTLAAAELAPASGYSQ